MSNLAGHNVAAPIRPYKEEDMYPVAFASEIKGGYHSVDTIAQRNAISPDRREKGMVCYVAIDGANGSNGTEYQLIDGIDNSNWQVKNSGVNGSFTSQDGSYIVIEKGIITNITPVSFIENQMYDLTT